MTARTVAELLSDAPLLRRVAGDAKCIGDVDGPGIGAVARRARVRSASGVIAAPSVPSGGLRARGARRPTSTSSVGPSPPVNGSRAAPLWEADRGAVPDVVLVPHGGDAGTDRGLPLDEVADHAHVMGVVEAARLSTAGCQRVPAGPRATPRHRPPHGCPVDRAHPLQRGLSPASGPRVPPRLRRCTPAACGGRAEPLGRYDQKCLAVGHAAMVVR